MAQDKKLEETVRGLANQRKVWMDRGKIYLASSLISGTCIGISAALTMYFIEEINQSPFVYTPLHESTVYLTPLISIGGFALGGIITGLRSAMAYHRADEIDDRIREIEGSPGYKTAIAEQNKSETP